MKSPIGKLFGRSPIRPVERHMARAQGCVALLGEFLEAALARDWERAEAVRARIAEDEREADLMKRDIRARLPRSLFLPFARADLVGLLGVQDRLANRCKEIAGLMLARRMTPPEPLAAPFQEYFRTAQAASAQARKAVNELDELLEAGFRGSVAESVERLVVELDDMERACEDSRMALRAALYGHEDGIAPVDAVFLYRLIDLIGDIAFVSRKVGGRLLQLMAWKR